MASHYHPVTPEVIAKLKVIVGDENVRCDEETLIQYQTDEEGNPHYFRKPEVVVFPGSTEEVAAIVKLANEFLVPITPRAAGTNVADNPDAGSPSVMTSNAATFTPPVDRVEYVAVERLW